ncbi:MAG: SDR family oxidoreductase, partial [Nevskiales bacterium]
MSTLQGKTLFITGATRGIGLAIAKRAAADGANITIAAKTTEAHPKLEGTIYTAAEAIEAAGGKALPIKTDIRNDAEVYAAVEKTVAAFGGIDICVNNASAINLTNTETIDMKRYDLMHQINGRGTFLTSKACIPYLKKAENPHVLNLAPPLDLDIKWFDKHAAYSLAKYSMSVYAWAMAAEFKKAGIAFNCLWPRTTIATAAVKNLLGGDQMANQSRTPDIMGDAAHVILCKDSREFSGNFCIDDLVLAEAGVTDFGQYAAIEGTKYAQLMPDFFVPDNTPVPDV